MGERRLADRLDGRDNALNLIRLLLASTVVAAHSWDLTFGSPDGRILPWAGCVAVDCFFAISGFLIARSRTRLTLGKFVLHRMARIMPAFWVCLTFTALVLAPVVAWDSGIQMDWGDAWSYIWRNALLQIHQLGIGQTLVSAPFPTVWNPSLWTLWYEFVCYLVVAAVFAGRWDRGPVLLGFLTASAALMAVSSGALANLPLLRLGSFFAAGSLIYHFHSRVPISKAFASLSVVCVTATFFAGPGAYYALAPVPLAYLMLWLSATLPARIGAKSDVSYGVYVFASPLQQVAVAIGVPALTGPVGFAVVSLSMVLPVAWLSWIAIERPVLRRVRASFAQPRAQSGGSRKGLQTTSSEAL